MNTPLREHTDEWLFLAQHVGLPTRLLDWTEGLFVALYFALLEKEPTIWMLDPIELNRRSSSEPIEDNIFPLPWFDPGKAPATRLDIAEFAFHVATRSQSEDTNLEQKFNVEQYLPNLGNFNIRGAWELDKVGTDLPVAIHPTNVHVRMHTQKSCFTVQGKKKESLSNLVDSRILKKYIVSSDFIIAMSNDLRMIGVTHTSIFPDLDHLARELSETF